MKTINLNCCGKKAFYHETGETDYSNVNICKWHISTYTWSGFNYILPFNLTFQTEILTRYSIYLPFNSVLFFRPPHSPNFSKSNTHFYHTHIFRKKVEKREETNTHTNREEKFGGLACVSLTFFSTIDKMSVLHVFNCSFFLQQTGYWDICFVFIILLSLHIFFLLIRTFYGMFRCGFGLKLTLFCGFTKL